MTDVIAIMNQLAERVAEDATKIDAIVKTAIDDIEVILAAYGEATPAVSLSELSRARNLLTTMKMHFPPQVQSPVLPVTP